CVFLPPACVPQEQTLPLSVGRWTLGVGRLLREGATSSVFARPNKAPSRLPALQALPHWCFRWPRFNRFAPSPDQFRLHKIGCLPSESSIARPRIAEGRAFCRENRAQPSARLRDWVDRCRRSGQAIEVVD